MAVTTPRYWGFWMVANAVGAGCEFIVLIVAIIANKPPLVALLGVLTVLSVLATLSSRRRVLAERRIGKQE